ncbi:class I SAM-dependent methyltransferase [Streptomyces sp. MZ04]|uniref:class I SAM-dependent methyltransferase n=1 Tax=Streptomyces sp. MZ04 TaxID=2559236 RepID=UPI00107EB59C|nr:class I SAM-dependent methyltransferase [Streptomyces sp. MZ04]TGA96253.1 class I SAM-dependent methyltransferase [Streptomyces sp. MZ04]
MDGRKRNAELDGVAETTLWTLHHRALAARNPGSALTDPKAIEVIDAVDYPFERRFGTGGWGLAQGMAVRARCYDRVVRRFLDDHPDGTVVSLGEGLETQFWRVDNGRVRWLGVDLPEVAELRQRLLPDAPRHRTLSCSATDAGWMDEVDASRGVLIIAQGMLMYLPLDVVHRLIEACAVRFPGAELVFDTPPAWMAARTARGRWTYPAGYRPPPMLWGMTPAHRRKLRGVHPNITAVRAVREPRGRGLLCGWLLPLASLLPAIRTRKPLWVTRVSFGLTEHHQGVNR